MFLSQLEPLTGSQQKQLTLLRSYIKGLQKVCIAYSGGVDSSLVATIAYEQLKQNAFTITGVSASLAPHLLLEARQQASWIGIRHKECQTNELLNPSYYKNPENRCFTCKKILHKHLKAVAKNADNSIVIDGVNYDDLAEYRPGIDASKKAGVRSPLAELKITKATIRDISRALGLPWWDKPAQPCLASRIPYGEEIKQQRLEQIAKAEKWIINKGFSQVRVRSQGLSSKIEIPAEEIHIFMQRINFNEIVEFFKSIGFNSVSIDLEGLVSGKLNRDIEI